MCDDTGYAAWSDAHASATAATISFVVAGAAIGAAVIFWAIGRGSDAPPPARAAAPFAWRF